MDDAEWEWRALRTQVARTAGECDGRELGFLKVVNCIDKDIEMTDKHINHRGDSIVNLKGEVARLKEAHRVQDQIISDQQQCLAVLKLKVDCLISTVQDLEKLICQCWDRLLSPGPHLHWRRRSCVDDLELEYETEKETSGLDYGTPNPLSSPSLFMPLRSPTPEDSDPERNCCLQTELMEARIEGFLEEAEEDMELDDLPPLENSSPVPIPTPRSVGTIPFAVSTGQCCIHSRGLPRPLTYHPYHHLVKGQCCCEPGSWCGESSCRGWWSICKNVGHDHCGREHWVTGCYGSPPKEPSDQLGPKSSRRSAPCAQSMGSVVLWAVAGEEGGQNSPSAGSSWEGLFWWTAQ